MDEFLKSFQMLRRYWLPASLALSLGLGWGGWRVSQEVPIYQASAQMLFKKDTDTATTLLDSVRGDDPAQLYNQSAILQSIGMLRKVGESLNPKKDVREIRDSLNVVQIPKTDILEISYKSTDPKVAKEVVNTLVALYIEQDTQENLRDTLAAKTFISQKLMPQLEASIQQAEAKIKDFKQKNRVLDVEAEAASTAEIISGLDAEIAATKTELASQTSRLQSLASLFGTDPQEAVVSGFIAESPNANSLLGKLQELQEKIRIERLRYGENHPQIVYLKRQEAVLRQELQNYLKKIFVGQAGRNLKGISIDKIIQPGQNQQQLLQEFNNTAQQVRLLKVKLGSMVQQIDFYKKRVDRLPELEFRQRRLNRQLAVRDAAYESLLQRYQQVSLEANRKSSNVQIVQQAELPAGPLPSRTFLYLTQAAIAGLLLAWGVAWVLEQLDKTAKSIEAVKEVLPYPALGTIPEFYKKLKTDLGRPVMLKQEPNSVISEGFRILYTNLRFALSTSEHPVQTMAISSAVTKEGKSTISANLSAAAAELGRRVLIIDCDLRNPSQHKVWQLPNERGLLGLLRDGEEIGGAVQEVMPNLDVIVAGGVNRNPVAMLDGVQMRAVIAYGKNNYDLVILDTPPLTVAADATILGKLVDGLLLVVRPSLVNVFSLQSSKDLLEQSRQEIIGMIFNGIAPRDTYGYYYKYPYAYGTYGQPSQVKSAGR